MFNATKFKTLRHTIIGNDSLLPPKGQLIQICKNDYFFPHTKLNLKGIASLKDRVIFAIYMGAMIKNQFQGLRTTDSDTFEELLGDRKALLKDFQKYTNAKSQS